VNDVSRPTYRTATGDDVDDIVTLVESAYRGDSSRVGWTTEADLLDGQRTDHAAVTDAVERQGSVVLLTPQHGALLGCCHLERRADDTCYFGMFAVAPTVQAAGIGRRLLAEAERFAREQWDATVMEMTVITQRRDLIAWYERRGYSSTGEMRPFPHGDERFGLPRRDDLAFEVLVKHL
jgi:ribosomal protein S18 acetylase RimI-like enzyme